MAIINIVGNNINTVAAQLPNVLIQYQDVQNVIQNANIGVIGIVGTAAGGQVNKPMQFLTPSDAALVLGAQQTGVYDLMTFINDAYEVASAYGSSIQFVCIRVTDGTDTAASKAIMDTAGTPAIGMTLTALNTGSVGNNLIAQVMLGSQANTYRVVIANTNQPNAQEVFDNISGSGATLWQNIVSAINNGQGAYQAASALVSATIGVGTAAPALSSYTFTGGTDGNTSVTNTTLIGDDTTTPKKGMYALDNQGIHLMSLVGVADSTTFATQLAFCQRNAALGIGTLPNGTSISSTTTLMQAAGVVSRWFKVMAGDWRYYLDTTNNLTRLITPQARVAGLRAALAPEDSTLNKDLFMGGGATFRAKANLPYTQDELLKLQNAGVDVMAQGSDAGASLFVCRLGINTDLYRPNSDDHVCMFMAFLGYSIAPYLGMAEGELDKPSVMAEIKNTTQAFLQTLVRGQRMQYGKAILDSTNNPEQQLRQGILRMDVNYKDYDVIRTVFLGINRNFPNQTTMSGQ